MATLGWRSDRAVMELLVEQFRQFDPLQLVRLWLRLGGPGSAERQEAGLRFKAELGAGFQGRPLSEVELEPAAEQNGKPTPAEEGARGRLCVTTADFCIGSALGPLPEPFLDWVREQDSAGHTATRDFLDLFNHRIHLLRWRMRAEFEPGLNNLPPDSTALAGYIAALMGMADAGGDSELHLPRRSWLGIGGLLVGARRSAAGMRQVLEAHLGCQVRVEPLVGTWLPIEAQDQQRLGQRRLGQDTLLGSHVWDTEQRVRLHIGELDFAQLVALLPPPAAGSLHAALAELLRLMLGHHHTAELCITVRPASVPASYLVSCPTLTTRPTRAGSRATQPGGVAESPAGLRLGQTAWLQRAPTAGPHTTRFVVQAHSVH